MKELKDKSIETILSNIDNVLGELSEYITDPTTAQLLLQLLFEVKDLNNKLLLTEEKAEKQMKVQERFEDTGLWIDVIAEDGTITSFLKRYAPFASRTEDRSYNHDYLPEDKAQARLQLERQSRDCVY